jgi:hypothetical protein
MPIHQRVTTNAKLGQDDAKCQAHDAELSNKTMIRPIPFLAEIYGNIGEIVFRQGSRSDRHQDAPSTPFRSTSQCTS